MHTSPEGRFLTCRYARDGVCTLTEYVYSLVDGVEKLTVSFATLLASSISRAILMAFAKVNSSPFSLKIALSIASLFTEQMNLVHIASSWESVIEPKSHVTASCRMRAANSVTNSLCFLLKSLQNLYLSRKTNNFGLYCSAINCARVPYQTH